MDYGRVICISSSTQCLEVLKRTSSEPDFLEVTFSRFKFFQSRSKTNARMVLVLRGACLSRREKKGECGVVRVNKVMEISRRVSDLPRVGNITLELSDTDRFEASER